ncbi:MAG: tRNA pseudouridine(38-40) synthase TruA [Actinomycetes bacterium]
MLRHEPADLDNGGGGLVRLRVDLGYDGTDFAGWARQPGGRTVQGVLEQALRTALRLEAVSTTCAGRTDAGVHARGQVAHVDVPVGAYEGQAAVLGRRLAGLLPRDVGLRDIGLAPAGFDARFSALWRRYAYRVSDARYGPDPLRRNEVLHHHRPLDVALMNAAAESLVGEHDFAAFCRRREGATTVRTLLQLSWERSADGPAVGTLVADAFCHNMVRALVGALVAVGDGRRAVRWPAEVLAGRERVPDVQVAGPHGLTLEEVRYPADEELGAQSERTRRHRGVAS